MFWWRSGQHLEPCRPQVFPDVTWTAEMRSFLDGCLTFAPEQRLTAKGSLEHASAERAAQGEARPRTYLKHPDCTR